MAFALQKVKKCKKQKIKYLIDNLLKILEQGF